MLTSSAHRKAHFKHLSNSNMRDVAVTKTSFCKLPLKLARVLVSPVVSVSLTMFQPYSVGEKAVIQPSLLDIICLAQMQHLHPLIENGMHHVSLRNSKGAATHGHKTNEDVGLHVECFVVQHWSPPFSSNRIKHLWVSLLVFPHSTVACSDHFVKQSTE